MKTAITCVIFIAALGVALGLIEFMGHGWQLKEVLACKFVPVESGVLAVAESVALLFVLAIFLARRGYFQQP